MGLIQTRILAYVLPVLWMTSPVAAEETRGIAFVEAPEQSSGACLASNPEKAFQCARDKCSANGTLASDCLRVKWCYPSGWSADIFMQHKEGPHWHNYLCGWSTREDLEAAAKIACEGSQEEWLIECSIVQIWDDQGKAIALPDQ